MVGYHGFSQELETQSLLRSYYVFILPLMLAVLENSLQPYPNLNLHKKHMNREVLKVECKSKSTGKLSSRSGS